MDTKQKWKYGILLICGAVIIMLILNYVFRVEVQRLEIIGGALTVMIPSLMAFVSSNKTNQKIDMLTEGFESLTLTSNEMQNAIKDIDESFKHRKEIIGICQLAENEVSDTFDMYPEVNTMLRDYIIGTNDAITDVIEKQYSYDFDLFDPNYFKNKILGKVNSLSDHIDYVMLEKGIFNIINNKVKKNIDIYIDELKHIKDIENGKRRVKFREETINLIKKITNHSIYLYRSLKNKTDETNY